jgi:opacity protein-like surface antigen
VPRAPLLREKSTSAQSSSQVHGGIFMLIHILRIPVFALLILVWSVAPARAQSTYLSPYAGSSFNSSLDSYDFGTKWHYGAALTHFGSGLGFELDYAYAPTFFEPGEDDFFDLESKGNLTTLMANLVIGKGGGGFKPYASGGVGLMRSRVEGISDLLEWSDNGFGLNVGAGLRVGGGHFGLRGDLRYFRQLSELSLFDGLDLGDFSFWRSTVGVSLGF